MFPSACIEKKNLWKRSKLYFICREMDMSRVGIRIFATGFTYYYSMWQIQSTHYFRKQHSFTFQNFTLSVTSCAAPQNAHPNQLALLLCCRMKKINQQDNEGNTNTTECRVKSKFHSIYTHRNDLESLISATDLRCQKSGKYLFFLLEHKKEELCCVGVDTFLLPKNRSLYTQSSIHFYHIHTPKCKQNILWMIRFLISYSFCGTVRLGTIENILQRHVLEAISLLTASILFDFIRQTVKSYRNWVLPLCSVPFLSTVSCSCWKFSVEK